MDPFLPLSFIQAVVPSTKNQIAQCLCKVQRLSQIIFARNRASLHPRTMHHPNLVADYGQDLASKYIRAALPAAQCRCGAIVIGSVQEDEFSCFCGRFGSIGHLKRSSDSTWIPHPFSSCSACHTWNLLGTSGSVER
jgi:hypothetical protein